MKKFLVAVLGILLIADIIQFCNSSRKTETINKQREQLDCFERCR